MGNFECNGIEDLVFNRSFREWVLSSPTGELGFWDHWIAENPDRSTLVNNAKSVIYALHINLAGLSEEAIDQELAKILDKLTDGSLIADEAEEIEQYPQKRNTRSRMMVRMSAAAALLAAILTGTYYFRHQNPGTTPAPTYEAFIAKARQTAVEKVNSTDTTQLLILPDGSRVALEASSKLSYAINFSPAKREVYLSGEAFFIIEKDPSRPFFVYTNSIVTKVLGTSFRVRAYATDKKAVLTVKTGKVSVFRAENFGKEELKTNKLGVIVVTPNQEVIYTRDNNELNKTITERPEIVAVPATSVFDFDATPVKLVFKAMQETYNIPILYDEEIMSGCSLSAKIGEASFYGKLDLICKAINASYEMIDGQIVIVSKKGCK